MKVLILSGGLGSRLSEETDVKPKPMVEIGGKPILWHIMKIYSHFGFNDFIVLCGYKGYVIKEYFANYFMHYADVTFDLAENRMKIHNNPSEPWKVTLLDTGLETMTGGRVLRARQYLPGNEPFMLTYGDGVADINIGELISFHKQHGKTITMTSSQPEGRFGHWILSMAERSASLSKNQRGTVLGSMPVILCVKQMCLIILKEIKPSGNRPRLKSLAEDDQLYTYKHSGFWHPMDTLRDKIRLEQMWNEGKAPWKIWDK